jgi:hypothetical protein
MFAFYIMFSKRLTLNGRIRSRPFLPGQLKRKALYHQRNCAKSVHGIVALRMHRLMILEYTALCERFETSHHIHANVPVTWRIHAGLAVTSVHYHLQVQDLGACCCDGRVGRGAVPRLHVRGLQKNILECISTGYLQDPERFSLS